MNQEILVAEIVLENKILTPAEKHYIAHRKNVARYQKNNPDKCKIKNRLHFQRIRLECPEQHQKSLQAQREYYINVTKPKKAAIRAMIKLNKLQEQNKCV